MADATEPRTGTPSPALDEAEFRRRFLSQYIDPAFAPLTGELDRIAAAAWDAYSHHRKAPRTQKAGTSLYSELVVASICPCLSKWTERA